jgi:hypothetical protein
LSATTFVELGLSRSLWGSVSSSPLYGYSRLEFSASTAGVYNSGQAALELFPISFLGGRAGGESIQNDQDYSAYNCDDWRCRGRFYRTFAETELSLGVGSIFFKGRWRRERWTQKEREHSNFIDPTSGLVMSGTGDSQTVYHGLCGVRVSSRWSALGGLRYAENQRHERSRFPFMMFRYNNGSFSAGFGGGLFESELKSRAGSMVAFLRWEIGPGPALH